MRLGSASSNVGRVPTVLVDPRQEDHHVVVSGAPPSSGVRAYLAVIATRVEQPCAHCRPTTLVASRVSTASRPSAPDRALTVCPGLPGDTGSGLRGDRGEQVDQV